MPYSLVFFGTQTFAATILQGLVNDPDFQVRLVITQPDRPVGRKKIITPPPVKVLAQSLGIPVLQPETLKDFAIPIDFQPDCGVVAQYGKIIPQRLLDWPTHGLINTHTSLLPKYRGASPVQAALLHGDTETGITIMKMDAGMDTGPILLQEKITIAPNDRYPEVEANLAKIAVPNLIAGIKGFISGTITPQPQPTDPVSLCGKLDRDSGRIDWSQPATVIYNRYRALYPWPGTWCMLGEERLKLLEVLPANLTHLTHGQLFLQDKKLYVGCANQTALQIITYQREGKTPQPGSIWNFQTSVPVILA